MTTISTTPTPLRSAAAPGVAAGPFTSMGHRLVLASLHRIHLGQLTLIDHHAGTSHTTQPTTPAPLSLPTPHATITVHDPRFYSAAAFGGDLGIADSFIDALWTCDDLPTLFEIMALNLAAAHHLHSPLARLAVPFSRAAYWLQRNSRAGSRRNIAAHYDLGNDFFSLFLDPSMTYSSAYFPSPTASLHEAQIEKIDRACRALDLKPSDHLLEIGTGWGSLAIHAATHYGCRVTTTTISAQQHRAASDRIRAAGLHSRITLLNQDYRDLSGSFDKLVSIEMIEAVGRQHIPTFFAVCSRLLKPTGAALIQAIVIADQAFDAAARRRDFLKKYIFPGSCLLGVNAMLAATASHTDLQLRRLDDFGQHYAATLRAWRAAFLSRLDDARALGYDDRFLRMWDYYLAYSQGVFRSARTSVVQLLFAKPLCRSSHVSPPPASPPA